MPAQQNHHKEVSVDSEIREPNLHNAVSVVRGAHEEKAREGSKSFKRSRGEMSKSQTRSSMRLKTSP